MSAQLEVRSAVSESWYAVRYEVNRHKSIIQQLDALNVDVFPPYRTKVYHQKNSRTFATHNVLLFPGYLLVKMDFDVVHTSVVMRIMGIYGFVHFGGHPPMVIPDSVIANLRKSIEQFQKNSVTPVARSNGMAFIVSENSSMARAAAFGELLKQVHATRNCSRQNKMIISS